MSHWATAYIGMPYAKAGDDPSSGMNCWNFARHVELQQFGLCLPTIAEPAGLAKLLRRVPAAAVALGWATTDRPRSGAVALMAHWKHPSHCGVWVDDAGPAGAVLHCVAGAGSVLHDRRHLELTRWRIIAFYQPLDMPAAAALELKEPARG